MSFKLSNCSKILGSLMMIEPYNLNVVAPPGTQASPPAEMIEPYNLNVVVPSPKKLMNNYTAITC